jgi:hypothetical protein
MLCVWRDVFLSLSDNLFAAIEALVGYSQSGHPQRSIFKRNGLAPVEDLKALAVRDPNVRYAGKKRNLSPSSPPSFSSPLSSFPLPSPSPPLYMESKPKMKVRKKGRTNSRETNMRVTSPTVPAVIDC